MALPYFPRAGEMLVCDLSDFKAPEMDKVRPVIVISPRLPHRSHIVAIVPVSTTKPQHSLPFCVQLSKNYHPKEPDQPPPWAKCDMLLNISTERLNQFKIGRREWAQVSVSADDLRRVRDGVLHALGFGNLIVTANSLK